MAKQSKSNAVKIKFKGDNKNPIDSPNQEEKMSVEKFDLVKNEEADFEYDDYKQVTNGYEDIEKDNLNFSLQQKQRAQAITTPKTTSTLKTTLTSTLSSTTGENAEMDFQTQEPFEVPKRKNYIITVTVPVLLGLLSVAILIYVLFRSPCKVIDILSDEPFLTWDEYYESEMQKQGLMVEGGYCLCEDRLMGLLTEAGIQLPKKSNPMKEEADIEQQDAEEDEDEEEEESEVAEPIRRPKT
ncbi:uncharacterized protein LOC123297791 [Chrysoperla carnea]|uniref:uncharacterized protein LOC123297791 n=1 Tax=Chrysoperla carnea TaxID=189513 RepID=UPI001D078064|nr:uncharacterized protein LOC123297791 [Chrysoperla carnea]